LRGGERIPSKAVEVLVAQRGQPGHVLVADVVALGAELGDLLATDEGI
jgi:hypothetical protein